MPKMGKSLRKAANIIKHNAAITEKHPTLIAIARIKNKNKSGVPLSTPSIIAGEIKAHESIQAVSLSSFLIKIKGLKKNELIKIVPRRLVWLWFNLK